MIRIIQGVNRFQRGLDWLWKLLRMKFSLPAYSNSCSVFIVVRSRRNDRFVVFTSGVRNARLLPLTSVRLRFLGKHTVSWYWKRGNVARLENRKSSNTPGEESRRPVRRLANHADQIVGRSCQRGLTVTRPRPRTTEGMPLYANQKAAEGWPQPRSLGIDSQIWMLLSTLPGCRCHYRCDRWRMNY